MIYYIVPSLWHLGKACGIRTGQLHGDHDGFCLLPLLGLEPFFFNPSKRRKGHPTGTIEQRENTESWTEATPETVRRACSARLPSSSAGVQFVCSAGWTVLHQQLDHGGPKCHSRNRYLEKTNTLLLRD